MIAHHPPEEYLADYAAGVCDGAVGLLIATHLTYCPACRAAAADGDHMGGLLLEGLTPAPLDGPALVPQPLAMDQAQTRQAYAKAIHPTWPTPLKAALAQGAKPAAWRFWVPGVAAMNVPLGHGAPELRVLRIQGGWGLPRHSHTGPEMTLVLEGGFGDGHHDFQVGDVAYADQDVDHRPVAHRGPACVCLAVTDSPLRLTGPLGRLVSQWLV